MLSYSVITAARNESANLVELFESLRSQTVLPSSWLIAENGSTDDTRAVAESIAAAVPWVRVISVSGDSTPVRGAPIVRALHAALEALDGPPDLVANVDADVTMGPAFFETLLARFEEYPDLGIASGSAWERAGDEWVQKHVTGDSVWGATRVYRWACLQDVLPFVPRLAWEGIDEAIAGARGWRTRTFVELPFEHHRPEGERDGSSVRRWKEVGRSCHYLHYRIPYLFARTAHHARRDPAAVAILWGFAGSVLRREPRLPDARARQYVRDGQRLRDLPARRREALGRRPR
jgi:glycosyltransferase involved in cell wall biosynthesis